jgi:TolB protein
VAVFALGETSSARAAVAGLTGRIVFTRELPGNTKILVMNADGTGQTFLDEGRFLGWDSYSPDWSPDGIRIAFVSQFGDNDPQISVMSAYGTGRKMLTTEPGYHGDPDWSPDGTKLAFAFSSRPGNDQGIAVINADGSGRTDLTNSATDRSPAWSPDGRKIAFVRFFGNNGENSEILVMNADGSDPTNLTNSAVMDADPAWSPDGGRIAFTTDRPPCCNRIVIMNADGSGKTAVSAPPRGALGPAWSPDGRRIAFSSELLVDGPRPEIFVINVDGSGRTKLTKNRAIDSSPDWHAGSQHRRCLVPDVVGEILRTARTRLRRANCSVGRIRRTTSRRVGRVISQSPRAGAFKRLGFPVKLVVGRR